MDVVRRGYLKSDWLPGEALPKKLRRQSDCLVHWALPSQLEPMLKSSLASARTPREGSRDELLVTSWV